MFELYELSIDANTMQFNFTDLKGSLKIDYSQLSNKSTGTMKKSLPKISCGTHFFLRYYWNEFKIFTCGTFISAVL